MRPLTLATGAEPFLYRGGPRACLLIHGFTGTPYDMRRLGQYLSAKDFTVLAPRLAHHATHPSDMKRSHWHDWYLSALDGWHMLRTECDQVAVVGLSAGGVTALLMAAREPVAAVVSISAPMLPNHDWRMRFTRYLAGVLPYFPKQDPGVDLETERIYTAYPVWPVGALTELQEYLRTVDAALPEITAPAQIIHASGDDVAPVANLDHIYSRVGSAEKESVLIDVDEHVITDGRRKEEVFNHVGRFLATHMA